MLFEGGSTFSGSISVRSATQGTATQPVVFGSYGTSRAFINSGTSYGFYAYNAGGIEIRNLTFEGAGRLTNTNSGVVFYLDSANVHLTHVVLDGVQVHGYRESGISIGSWKGGSGYNQVRITNCVSSANGEAGISSYSEDLSAHHDWYVGNCKTFDNSGRTDITDIHTGNGIVLGGINGALVEHCEAYHNGWLNANPHGGPVGIWGYNCNQLVIQHCESHHNQSGTSKDGGGFDIDGGSTNSILQYNYSHDNEGPGYLIAQYVGAPPLTDVTIRYNISENDGRRYNHGAIQLWSSGSSGGIQRANIHNNTIFLSPPADGSRPKAVDITSDGISGIVFRNNLLQTSGGLAMVYNVATQGVVLQGNAYWSSGSPLLFQCGGDYNSLEAWREATGQEQVGTRATGIVANPGLLQPGAGGTLAGRPLSSLNSYQLQPNSTLLNTGLDLMAEFGVHPGPRDFFGTPTPARGAGRTIGAHEGSVVASNSKPAMAAWCSYYPNPTREALNLTLTNNGATGRAPVVVKLYDLMGRLQFAQTYSPAQVVNSDTKLRIPLGALSSGHYQLEVLQGEKRYGQAVVIE